MLSLAAEYAAVAAEEREMAAATKVDAETQTEQFRVARQQSSSRCHYPLL